MLREAKSTLCIWRTANLNAVARGAVLGFYVDDERLECLWRFADKYAKQFTGQAWGAIIEPDYSLWRDAPLAAQVWNVFRMRTLGRLYQAHGLCVIPNFTWSDERSYEFCFQGIPRRAPVVACECRTASAAPDRARFFRGLAEGVRQVQPRTVLIYGGQEHKHWLGAQLPAGPRYVLIEAWTRVRRQEGTWSHTEGPMGGRGSSRSSNGNSRSSVPLPGKSRRRGSGGRRRKIPTTPGNPIGTETPTQKRQRETQKDNA